MNLFKNLSAETIKGRILQNAACCVFPHVQFDLGTFAAGDTITIGDQVFEAYANGGDPASVTEGSIAVELGSTAGDTRNNVQAALEANVPNLLYVEQFATNFLLVKQLGTGGDSFALSVAAADSAANDTIEGESGPFLSNGAMVATKVATAADVAMGNIRFPFHAPITQASAVVNDGSDTFTAVTYDGAMTRVSTSAPVGANSVLTLDNTGASDFSAGNAVVATVSF